MRTKLLLGTCSVVAFLMLSLWSLLSPAFPLTDHPAIDSESRYELQPKTPVFAEVPATTSIVAEDAPVNTSVVYPVVSVIDGDTIDVAIAGKVTRIRYIGINTPETVHPTRSAECFGAEASQRNRELVKGKYVQLEKDISDTDRYGRLLRYVYVDGRMINELLVEEGYASVSTYPPDVKHTERFLAAEVAAREAGSGLWGAGCSVYYSPSSVEGGGAATQSDGQCVIKGNINQSGERIYHTPNCDYYSRTVITEAKGERWFCTEGQALEAGWRKALNCQ